MLLLGRGSHRSLGNVEVENAVGGRCGGEKIEWNRVHRQAQDEIIFIIGAEVALKTLSPIQHWPTP